MKTTTSKRTPIKSNPGFEWSRNAHNMSLLYRGRVLAYIVQNNPTSYSVEDRDTGKTYNFRTLTLAKQKALKIGRSRLKTLKFELMTEAEMISVVNRYANKAILKKHGKAVSVSPAGFGKTEWKITFADGTTATSKIPKKNPDVVSTFAGLANGVLAAMQINEHMKRTAKKKVSRKRSTVNRKKNPETKAEVAARMAKVRAARKNPGKSAIGPVLNPAKKKTARKKVRILGYEVTVGTKRHADLVAQKKHFDDLAKYEGSFTRKANPKPMSRYKVGTCSNCGHSLRTHGTPSYQKCEVRKCKCRKIEVPAITGYRANPRKTVKVPAKGRFYLQTIAVGDDVLGVFINDRDGDGVARKFKSVAAAKAYATRRRLALENPAKAPRKVNPTFAPAWIKKLLAKVTPKKAAKKKNPTPAAKANPVLRIEKGEYYVIGDAHDGFLVKRQGVRNTVKKFRTKAPAVALMRKMNAKRNPTPVKKAVVKVNPERCLKCRKMTSEGTYDANGGFCNSCYAKTATGKAQHVKRRRKNPPKAPRSRLFESFQGRTTSTTKRLETSQHLGSQRLIQLGKLHEIKLVGERPFKLNPSRAVLCATQTGKLAIAGAKFAKRNPSMRSNEISQIGEIEHVVYETHKPHHGDGPNQLYIHELGEVTGKRPTLCLDREGLPIIRGGEYKVRPEGIVN